MKDGSNCNRSVSSLKIVESVLNFPNLVVSGGNRAVSRSGLREGIEEDATDALALLPREKKHRWAPEQKRHEEG